MKILTFDNYINTASCKSSDINNSIDESAMLIILQMTIDDGVV